MLYMVMRHNPEGIDTRYGKPSKSLNRSVRQCNKLPNGSYIETYPGRMIVYLNTEEFKEISNG